MYLNDEVLIDEELELFQNDWIKDTSLVLDEDKYNVYHGVGNNSLVKLLIQEEIIVDL